MFFIVLLGCFFIAAVKGPCGEKICVSVSYVRRSFFFLNLVRLKNIWIVVTLFKLTCDKMEFHLVCRRDFKF